MGLLVVAVLAASGCGTSLEHDQIVAAWDGTGGTLEGVPGQSRATGTNADVAAATDGAPDGTAAGSVAPGGASASGAEGATAPSDTTVLSGGSPIRIGNVSTLTGPGGAALAPAIDAVRAWVRHVNAAGGIQGHQVELFVVDDGGDPARHAAAIQDLVENEGVIAFVGQYATFTNDAGRGYLEQHGIPVVGGDSTTPVWFESPMFFPMGAGRDPLGPFTEVLKLMTEGKNLALLVCTEASICTNARENAERVAPEAGYTIVYSGSGSLAQPDFTAQCIQMRNAGADVVIPIFDQATNQRLARSCARQGYFPRYYVAGGTAASAMASASEFEGSGGAVYSFPFAGTESHPAAAEFFDAMATYAPDVTIEPGTTGGWTSAKMFEFAAQHVGLEPTSAEILEGLWSFNNETLDGLAVPRTFHRGAAAESSGCAFVSIIRDGQWTAPQGMTPVCTR